jgi:hypothetical protein
MGGFFMTTKPARSRCSARLIGDDLRYELVSVVDALAALKTQGEGQRVGDIPGSGG